MPRHRGPHPDDRQLFADEQLASLRVATSELSWLLARGYKMTGALALVGNRHALAARARTAVQRASCTDDERTARAERRVEATDVAGRRVLLDGFNVVIALEAALSGGVLVIGRDGVLRDMASVHGSYRRVEETERAATLIAETLVAMGASSALIYLDRPVSNSGRLAGMLRRAVGDRVPLTIELVDDPDRRLASEGASSESVVCSGDGVILDRCGAWLDLPAAILETSDLEAWIIDLR